MAIDTSRFTIHPEVKLALATGQAVVALESTIISHGLPSPRNVAVAGDIEQSVRDGGAVPATIAIIDGVVKVGLTPAELEILGDPNSNVIKVSTRDLGPVLAAGDTVQQQCQQPATLHIWQASSSSRLVV